MSDQGRRVVFSPAAEKDLRGLELDARRRILTAIEGLRELPLRGDIKKLQGRQDQWRLRVGDWRVIFEVDARGHTVYIVRVLARKDAYRL